MQREGHAMWERRGVCVGQQCAETPFFFSNEFCLMVFVLDQWALTLMDSKIKI